MANGTVMTDLRRQEQVTSINQNATTNTVSPVRIPREEIGWIISEAVATLFTIISVYLTTAAIIYKYRIWKKNRLRNGNYIFEGQRIKTVSGRTTFLGNDLEGQVRKSTASSFTPKQTKHWRLAMLDMLIIAAGVFVTLRMISEQLALNFSDQSEHLCDVIADILVTLYALPIAAIYIFLWLRQRILYSRPPLSLFNPRIVRAISTIIIVFMVIGLLATILAFTILFYYEPGPYGCGNSHEIWPKWIPWTMILILSGTFQILLLSLYIAPMISMRLSSKREAKEGQLRKHGEDPVIRSIKRVCAITCACVFSDLLAYLITFASTASIVSNLVYDLNLLVNLAGIICSFRNWKERICPLCYTNKTQVSRDGLFRCQPSACLSKPVHVVEATESGSGGNATNQSVYAQGA